MEVNGSQLMEVFNIRYLSHDTLLPEAQCGTISLINDSKAVQYLYKVLNFDKSKPSIKYGDDIVVTMEGPARFSENHCMQFDLFDGAYKDTLNLEEWDSCALYNNRFYFNDRRIKSQDGTGVISVQLGFYNDAITACLKVTLLNNPAPAAASNVYGVVVASNSKLDRPRYTSVLFVKKADNKIQVGDDGVIPLSKSRVAVPLDSKLYVDISLHVNDARYGTTACFDAKNAVAEVHSTQNILINVTWDVNMIESPSPLH